MCHSVRDDWVTLTGTVSWQYQKVAAEKAIEHLYGVKGVANSIVVRSPAAIGGIRQKIEAAFERSADIDAKRITIEAHDGTVTLMGTVHSLAERGRRLASSRSTTASSWRAAAKRKAIEVKVA